MLKPLSAAILFAIGSLSAQAAEFVLSDATTGSDVGDWKVSSDSSAFRARAPSPWKNAVCTVANRKGSMCC